MERPQQIQPHHLARLAIVYPRQSTTEEVRDNTGSTQFQLRLTERALQWGWPESRIVVIADDLGVSGSRPGRRQGFRRMLDLMRRDEVGIVFASEAPRLSRNPLDAEEFLWAAIRHNGLVEVGGKLFCPGDADLAELFNLRLRINSKCTLDSDPTVRERIRRVFVRYMRGRDGNAEE